MKKIFPILGVLAILVGCERDSPQKYSTENTTPPISPSAPLFLNHTGNDGSYDCEGREILIERDATANRYSLAGECKSLRVDGVSNVVTVYRVSLIEVSGTSNKIFYRDLINGMKPKIIVKGTDNAVEQTKPEKRR